MGPKWQPLPDMLIQIAIMKLVLPGIKAFLRFLNTNCMRFNPKLGLTKGAPLLGVPFLFLPFTSKCVKVLLPNKPHNSTKRGIRFLLR